MQRIAASGVTRQRKGSNILNCFETLRNPETKTCDVSNLAGSKSLLHYASLIVTKTLIVSWQLQNKNHNSPCYGAGYDPGVGQSIPSQILTTIMPKWCKMIQHVQTCQANPSKASSTSAFGMDVQIDGSCRVSWSERPWSQQLQPCSDGSRWPAASFLQALAFVKQRCSPECMSFWIFFNLYI